MRRAGENIWAFRANSRFVYAEGLARTHNIQVVQPELIANAVGWVIEGLSLPWGIAVFLQLLESTHFSRFLIVLSVVAAVLDRLVVGVGWAEMEGTLSPRGPRLFTYVEPLILNITTSPTTSADPAVESQWGKSK